MCKCLSNLSIVLNWCDTQPYTPYQCATFWCNGYRTKIDAIGAITLKYNTTCVVSSAIGIKTKAYMVPITLKPQYKTKIIIIIIIISMVSHTIIILIPYNTTTTTYYFKPSNNKKRNTHTFHQTLFA